MTTQELVARFPEIPADLHDEVVLERFASTFDGLLQIAHKPSACSSEHDAPNHFYLKLIGPLAIYGYGLSPRDKVLGDLQDLLARFDADPGGFADSLLPADLAS